MPDQTGDDLLALGHRRARRGLVGRATPSSRATTDPLALSYAHQALGIVLRDRGDIDLALTPPAATRPAARRSATGRPRPARGRARHARRHARRARPDRRRAARARRGRRRGVGPQGAVRPKVLMRRANVLALRRAATTGRDRPTCRRRCAASAARVTSCGRRAHSTCGPSSGSCAGEFAEARARPARGRGPVQPGDQQRLEVLRRPSQPGPHPLLPRRRPGGAGRLRRARRRRTPTWATRTSSWPSTGPASCSWPGSPTRRSTSSSRASPWAEQPPPGPGRAAGACGPPPSWAPGRPELALEDARAARRLFAPPGAGRGGAPAPTWSPCRPASSSGAGRAGPRSPSPTRWPTTRPRTPCSPTCWPAGSSRGPTRRPRRRTSPGPPPAATAAARSAAPPPGWPGPSSSRCGGGRACSTRSGAGSTRWPSTGRRWAVPSCAP